MYLQHFGLADEPFRITPDPRFLHLDPAVDAALATVADGLERRAGLVVLVGEVGTGKTTLVRHLLDTLPPHVRTVLVLHPTVSFDEILDHVLLELGLPVAGGGPEALLERLGEFLREHAREGGTVAVFFDEAQALHEETLASLPELLDLVADAGRPALQIVLAGQPELDARLAAPALEPLRRRVGAVARLQPLSRDGVLAYVRARLARAGAQDAELFRPEALARVAALSGGVPRVVNVLCEAALVAAFADSQRHVTAPHIDAAWADYAPLYRPEGAPMPQPPAGSAAPEAPATAVPQPRRVTRWLPIAAAAVAALALLPLLAIRPWRRATPVAVDAPPTSAPAPAELPPPAPPSTVPAIGAEPIAPPPEPPAIAEPAVEPAPMPTTVAEPATRPAPAPRPPDVTPPPRIAPPATLDAIDVVDRFWRAYEARDADGVRALFVPEAVPPGAVLDVDPTGRGVPVTPTGHIEAKPVGDRVTVRVPFQLNARDDRGRAVRRQGVASVQVALRDGVPRIVALAAESGPAPRR